jgi:hypothetical protein
VKEQAKPRRVTITAGAGAAPIDTAANGHQPEPVGASS